MGAGIYKDHNEAFATLEKLEVIAPDEAHRADYAEAYARWKATLEKEIN
jgi:xylulokinase